MSLRQKALQALKQPGLPLQGRPGDLLQAVDVQAALHSTLKRWAAEDGVTLAQQLQAGQQRLARRRLLEQAAAENKFIKTQGVKADLRSAAAQTNTNPSDAQIEAGNYRKGKVKLYGLPIALENPKGSTRSGVSRSGKRWSTTMNAHYGYVLGTLGHDGDHVDVFIGSDPESEYVLVINQVDPGTRKFDEHKCILGCRSEKAARKLYLANYEEGWKGLGSAVGMTMPQFKTWLSDRKATRREAQQLKVATHLIQTLRLAGSLTT